MLEIPRREDEWFGLGDDGAKACVRFFGEGWVDGATTGVLNIGPSSRNKH
jgi:hypothetical protein